MHNLLQRLNPRDRRGSKPRCHIMTHGHPEKVAMRLTELIAPWGRVTPDDRWMPVGFDQIEEAQLHEAPRLLDPKACEQLKKWWFAIVRGKQTAPSFDIASTCTVTAGGVSKQGLLLVEEIGRAHV